MLLQIHVPQIQIGRLLFQLLASMAYFHINEIIDLG